MPEPFHNPPPSLAAWLLITEPPVILVVALPPTCKAPPLPGLEFKGDVTPTLLLSKITPVKLRVPPVCSIAPPARVDTLLVNVVSVIVTVPPLLKIAPPEPETPSAKLLTILFPANTIRSPPLLNIAPPPVVGASPLAILSEKFGVGVLPTVIVLPS